MGHSVNPKLKAFVRVDGSGRVVPGTPVLQASKPKVGNWIEIPAFEGNVQTTTTTSTSTSTTTSTTSTTSTSTSTTTTTTTAGPLYYQVQVRETCEGPVLISPYVTSYVPAVIGKWYTIPGGVIYVLDTANEGNGGNYTTFFEGTPRDTCAG